MSTPKSIEALVAAPLATQGYVVDSVSVTPMGRRSVVRVAVEHAVTAHHRVHADQPIDPITLDDVAQATRVVSDLLDASDVMGEAPYVLEVSSPGVGKGLQGYEALRRNVGRLVHIVRRDSQSDAQVTGPSSIDGRLLVVTGDVVTVRPDPVKGRQPADVDLPMDQVVKASVRVEFTHAAPDVDGLTPIDPT